MAQNKTIGVLLSGGQSQRFGEAKAFYILEGKYFYQSSLEAIQGITDNTIIVSHPSLYQRFKDQKEENIILDVKDYSGLGPLAGIYSAMVHQPAERYVILPCDTPYINKETVEVLLAHSERHTEYDVLVPTIEGRKQPLIAIYRYSCLPIIKRLLDRKQLRMGILLDSVQTMYVEEACFKDTIPFQNINRKEDLNEKDKG